MVELGALGLGLAVVAVHGYGISSLFYCGLAWTLLALLLIDFDCGLLPDQITQPLLWAGLLINALYPLVPLVDAVLGAIFGYLSLWSVFWAFKLATGKDGMGYGDFKLLAALGGLARLASSAPGAYGRRSQRADLCAVSGGNGQANHF